MSKKFVYWVKFYVMPAGMQPPGDWELARKFDTSEEAESWVETFVQVTPKFIELYHAYHWISVDDIRIIVIEEKEDTES